MKGYVSNVMKALPMALRMAQVMEVCKDKDGLVLYGYYSTSVGFWTKLRLGLKAR